MDTAELHRLCGLDQVIIKAKKPKWVSAKLKFLGAENYVLGTKIVEVAVTHKARGIALLFRHPLVIEASVLLGKHHISGLLVDVDVVFGATTESAVTLRLASMNVGMYPIVLRNTETVALI